MARTKKPRLGRGLSSLMASPVTTTPQPVDLDKAGAADTQSAPPGEATPAAGGLRYIAVEAIEPNPHQPRQRFDRASLDQLAASIKQDGLMQPVVLRPDPSRGDRYELVAGERRWRAARLAGLDHLPAIVRELSDQQLAEWALIENLQREDLDPIERAQAFAGLIEQFGLSHEQVADRVGIERPTVSNYLRLLSLHDDIQQAVRHRRLSSGHARALGGLDDPQAQQLMARQAIEAGWSVRQTEQAVRDAIHGEPRSLREGNAGGSSASGASSGDNSGGGGNSGAGAGRSPHVVDLERQIGQALQTKVHLKPARKKGAGALSIEYYSLDQFDALLTKLGVDVS